MTQTTAETINGYLTDMLALEDHIEKALHEQVDDLRADHPNLSRELHDIHLVVERHIVDLKHLSDERNAGRSGVAETVKRAGAAIAGLGAAAVDLVRTEKLPKNLRDDYTAASLATIGYVMLYTTSVSLGDRGVAELAQRHLADYARVTMTLHNIIPGAVISFLQEEGLPARIEVLSEISETIESVWTQQAATVPDADQMTSPRRRSTGS